MFWIRRKISAIQTEWDKLGISSYILGEFNAEAEDITVTRDGKEWPLEEPQVDPFWELFFAGLE